MRLIRQFLINGILLTVTSVIMRLLNVVFNVYITDKIGAAGVGLFSLVLSVYTFAVTFAVSGIYLASTRLVSQELVRNSGRGVRKAMSRSIVYALIFGSGAMVLLYFFSAQIALGVLCDIRTLKSLKLLAFSLPFMAISSALSGYFSAVRRVALNAVTNILEQFIRLFLTAVLLSSLSSGGIEAATVAIVIGMCVSEALAFLISLILYLFDRRKTDKLTAPPSSNITSRLIRMALPVAVSSYIRSALITLEHILIPKGLIKNGSTGQEALSSYGVISGMVFPVIFFPMAFLTAFSGLLVPEVTRYKEADDNLHIEYVTRRIIRITFIFAAAVAGIFIYYADMLGMMLYDSREAGIYIRIFAALIPVMYIDNAADSILKGLGEQVASMRYNIIDALVSVILVFFLLPPLGIKGYVIVIYVCEMLNASLSLQKLFRCVKIKLGIVKEVFFPILCIAGATGGVKLIFYVFRIQYHFNISGMVTGIILIIILYTCFLRLFGSVTDEDEKWFLGIFKKKEKKERKKT